MNRRIGGNGVVYRRNPSLAMERDDYPGNPVAHGRFLNCAVKPPLSWLTVLRWYLSRNPQKNEKKADPYRLPVHDPRPAIADGRDMLLWLGHACFLIRLNGRTILTDPCLFDLPLIPRDVPMPLRADELGKIDYLLLSHSHRDHLDRRSLRSLDLTGTVALTPLAMGPQLKRIRPDLAVQEAGWYQRYDTGEGPRIVFLPAQHWSNRRLGDANRVLWGGFLVSEGDRSIYFTGDSAYGPHFAEIGRHMGPPSICLMPVGAYRPSFIMKNNHMDPAEAVTAFLDLGGRTFVPMHYATYDLSDEPPGEPLRILNDMHAQGKIPADFRPLAVGEALFL